MQLKDKAARLLLDKIVEGEYVLAKRTEFLAFSQLELLKEKAESQKKVDFARDLKEGVDLKKLVRRKEDQFQPQIPENTEKLRKDTLEKKVRGIIQVTEALELQIEQKRAKAETIRNEGLQLSYANELFNKKKDHLISIRKDLLLIEAK